MLAGAAVLILVAVPTATAPGAGAAPASGPPVSVMLQVSSLAPTYRPSTVARWLDRFCETGRNRPHELVLQDVATADGTLLTSYLDVITSRLPGGRRPCFDRAVVGTVQVPWTGAGSLYHDGILDAGYRQRHLSLSATTAAAFTKRYSKIKFDWYLTLEANLNETYYADVVAAYRTLLGDELRALARIRRRPAMWSPAFWYPHSTYELNVSGMATLRSRMQELLRTLATMGGGLRRIDLQDFVSGSTCQPDWNRTLPVDAVGWVRFLSGLGGIADVRVNTERFVPDCVAGTFSAAPLVDITNREQFYRTNGLTLGASFELRYWIAERAPLLIAN